MIELPAMNPGTLAYTCSMGMYGGTDHDRGRRGGFARRPRLTPAEAAARQ